MVGLMKRTTEGKTLAKKGKNERHSRREDIRCYTVNNILGPPPQITALVTPSRVGRDVPLVRSEHKWPRIRNVVLLKVEREDRN